MLRRYCDRCGAEMTTAASTFRFEIDRPDLPDKDKAQDDPSTSGYSSRKGVYGRPRVECDLCPECIESFTDWFTEYDEPPEPDEPNVESSLTDD